MRNNTVELLCLRLAVVYADITRPFAVSDFFYVFLLLLKKSERSYFFFTCLWIFGSNFFRVRCERIIDLTL